MPFLHIELDQASYAQLKAQAQQDRRTPRMEAEWLLIEVLNELSLRLHDPAPPQAEGGEP